MNIHWFFGRLGSMSPAEVVWRLGEQAKRRLAKGRLEGLARYGDKSDKAPILPGLEHSLKMASGEEREAIRSAANDILSGRFSALGVVWPLRNDPMCFEPSIWSLDPVTGQGWPNDSYCFDIPYRHQRDVGDVKYVWEFGRLQFLQVLAADYYLEPRPKVLVAIERAVQSWSEANPPFRGIHYAEILNVAMRAISLLVVTTFCGKALSVPTIKLVRALLRAHATWLERFPSLHSSANNHLIAELSAEYLIAIALGDNHSIKLREKAWRSLVDQVGRQMLPDGVNAEQSPAYGAYTAEFALLACLVAKGEGREIPDSVAGRLAAFTDQIFWLCDARGRVPNICDNDEGRVLTLCQFEARYPLSVATSIAGFLSLAGPPGVDAASPTLRTAIFGRHKTVSTPRGGLHVFSDGGLSVVRSKVQERPYILTFDHGPLGYLSIAAHGHADALSITLNVEDTPLLVDPGTYLYHSGGIWRDWFRGTPAHNTLNIEAKSQSVMNGPFNWSKKASAKLDQMSQDSAWLLRGSHDGYEASYGVTHERELGPTSEGLRIVDRVRGGESLDVQLVFQVAPGVVATVAGSRVRLEGQERWLAELEFGLPGEVKIASGGDLGVGGWVSEKFGQKSPAPRITWTGRIPEAGLVTQVRLSQ